MLDNPSVEHEMISLRTYVQTDIDIYYINPFLNKVNYHGLIRSLRIAHKTINRGAAIVLLLEEVEPWEVESDDKQITITL